MENNIKSDKKMLEDLSLAFYQEDENTISEQMDKCYELEFTDRNIKYLYDGLIMEYEHLVEIPKDEDNHDDTNSKEYRDTQYFRSKCFTINLLLRRVASPKMIMDIYSSIESHVDKTEVELEKFISKEISRKMNS